MKTRHHVSNHWQTWLSTYAEANGYSNRQRAQTSALLAREVDWIVRCKDEEYAPRLSARLSKFRSLGGEINRFDPIGTVKIAFWDWIFE